MIYVLPQVKESYQYLKKLNFKNVKFIGNLKYSQAESENLYASKNLVKLLSANKSGVHQVLIIQRNCLLDMHIKF